MRTRHGRRHHETRHLALPRLAYLANRHGGRMRLRAGHVVRPPQLAASNIVDLKPLEDPRHLRATRRGHQAGALSRAGALALFEPVPGTSAVRGAYHEWPEISGLRLSGARVAARLVPPSFRRQMTSRGL